MVHAITAVIARGRPIRPKIRIGSSMPWTSGATAESERVVVDAARVAVGADVAESVAVDADIAALDANVDLGVSIIL